MKQDLAALVAKLRELVILDEVRSNNPLGREAADALEAQAAEIARLNADLADTVKQWSKSQDAQVERLKAEINALDRAEKAEAVAAEAQALLTMAFEVAANTVARSLNDGQVTHVVPPSVKEAIISRTPTDAQAALEARINAAKEEGRVEGLREAADLCGKDNGPWEASAWCCRQAILAKIKEIDHD